MKKIYLLLFTLAFSSLSFGQTEIFNDGLNYDFATAPLLTSNGWNQVGGVATNPISVGNNNGLVYAGYNDGASSYTGQTSGNAAEVVNNGQDVIKNFTAVTTGSLYYTLLVNVTDAATPEGYFTHLNNGSTFTARVFVRASATTGKINFGVSNSSTGVYSPVDYNPNTTYLLVIKEEIGASAPVKLWVFEGGNMPATEATVPAVVTTSGSGVTQVNGISLRQYNDSQVTIVDGLYISDTWFGTTPCDLVLGTEVATCDAVTLAIDTYSVTIPYTGGATGTYNLSANAGTVGGDNPTTTAAGNITITNIPEGTSVTLTITGACGLSKSIAASECKPENTLPYNEPFNYTPATALGTTQMWSTLNTGDDIVAASGNLTYPGITSTGNSITFAGQGADARTPLAPVNSGTIYASFIANVTDVSTVVNDLTDVTYFALFDASSSSFTNARVWHRRNGTQSQFGIGTTALSSSVVWSSNLHTPGTPIYLVLGYDFATGLVTLTENPTIGGTASPSVSVTIGSLIGTIGGFALRQDSANTTPNIIIDELRIDTTPNFTLGTSTFNNISGLNVYPNPANDFLHITTAANGVKNVAIYDVVGKEVLNTTTANETINVSSLNAGIYMVKITEEGKTATRKLVIK
ncbi:T9SS type A sorting domain-containing protein [Flavobacterium sp.]|uniref:T9SS type A sorting domain-containing protein n=1 Tax=Flavobacterium sp. TaxID=239 RepID=UPI0028BD9440|nr:T9SS type A sorting domain-containing protein [Flavobacterium sp.]